MIAVGLSPIKPRLLAGIARPPVAALWGTRQRVGASKKKEGPARKGGPFQGIGWENPPDSLLRW